ncbi:MAG: PIN domain-containing protein [Acidobacteriales bacterium]|nr:PIN domain-containing protein [Terriglobales bacterium]
MTRAAADSLLLDTNVLVYAASPTSSFHSQAIAALVAHRLRGQELWISTQIIREFLSVMCNPNLTKPSLTPEQAAVAVRYLLRRFSVAEDTHHVSRALSRLITQLPAGARRIHDGNIVATCQVHGIPAILTHNPQDSAPFSNAVRIEPLVAPSTP